MIAIQRQKIYNIRFQIHQSASLRSSQSNSWHAYFSFFFASTQASVLSFSLFCSLHHFFITLSSLYPAIHSASFTCLMTGRLYSSNSFSQLRLSLPRLVWGQKHELEYNEIMTLCFFDLNYITIRSSYQGNLIPLASWSSSEIRIRYRFDERLWLQFTTWFKRFLVRS